MRTYKAFNFKSIRKARQSLSGRFSGGDFNFTGGHFLTEKSLKKAETFVNKNKNE